MLARDKPSLLLTFVNYGRKSFISLCPEVNISSYFAVYLSPISGQKFGITKQFFKLKFSLKRKQLTYSSRVQCYKTLFCDKLECLSTAETFHAHPLFGTSTLV
jgi:hypothetical protein